MISYLLEHNRYCNLIGVVVVIALAWLFSRDRKSVAWRPILTALALQIMCALVILKTDVGFRFVERVAMLVNRMNQFAQGGIHFLFGQLSDSLGLWGFIFAVKVLPITIFFAAFIALLFHFNVIKRIVSGMNYLLRPLFKTSGAETVAAVSNSFLGSEAPLLIRHYVPTMTRSEIMVVMLSGLATINAAFVVVFSTMGVPTIHLLAASVMAIPSSIIMAKLLVPETERAVTTGTDELKLEVDTHNAFDAVARGTLDGLKLALNLAAFLISFLGLIALGNYALGAFSYYVNSLLMMMGGSWQFPTLSFQYIFSLVFLPFAYLLGFSGDMASRVGLLLGTKISINTLVSYSSLLAMNLDVRTTAVVTYALCGFANFTNIGIQIGALSALALHRRKLLTELGLQALLGASLANILSALIAGLCL